MHMKSIAATSEPESDTQLLAEFVNSSSHTAFATLVHRHSPMVLGVCRRMLRNADAEDAAQAVFVLFWQKARNIKEESLIAAWLHRTAHHVCSNAIQSGVSRIKHEQNAAKESSTVSNNSPDSEHWSEIAEILDAEVNQLPDKLRRPFVLFHLENRSLVEVAAMVGSSVPTIGTWLQRARERLAARLRRRGITIGATALAALLSQQVVAGTIPTAFVEATVQTAVGFSTCGIAANATSSPLLNSLLNSLLKAAAVGGVSKKAWLLSGLIAAALIGMPLAVFWFFPMMQTRLSSDFPLLQGEWREIESEQNGGAVNAKPAVEYVGSLVISGRNFHR